MTIRELENEFIKLYGDGGEIRFFHAPGRVNLIGEHTDYNGGYVFPATLSIGTTIALRKRCDNKIRMKATDLDDFVTIDIDNLDAYKDLNWGNYQAGVICELKKYGYHIIPCDMLYYDTIPHGGGLSSSAAVTVSTAFAFATLSNEEDGKKEPIDLIQLAKIAQGAENNYVGLNCGIMDHFASAMGKRNCAILLKCDTLDYSYSPLDMQGYSLIISNTNKKRSLASSKYNERRNECGQAFKILKSWLPKITCLADVSPEDFEKYGKQIKDDVIYRRARHIVLENNRVLLSAKALLSGDMEKFGELMNASHDSLRTDFEVTGIELDTLVDEARKIDGVLGSRMTGAGFGGCTVSLVKSSCVDAFINSVRENYKNKIGYDASFYVSEISDGVHEIKE